MEDNLLKVERQVRIRTLVEDRGRVTVGELSQFFDVSEATVRRDLEQMDERGLVRRTHGGAIRVVRASREPPMLQRINEQSEEKKRIGMEASTIIEDGETVFLGSGTTVLEIARHLPENIRLTVITNSLAVANELTSLTQVELIVIGGLFRASELSMVGHIAEHAVKEFRADRVFIGIRSIDPNQGFTNDFLPETMTDRAILDIGTQIIVVADHTKFGRVSSVFVAPVTSAQVIITDKDAPEDIVISLQELGLDVRQV